MKMLILALAALIASPVAGAGQAGDLCILMTIEQNGLRCKVIDHDDGSQSNLLIKSYVQPSDDEQRKARSRVAIRQLIDAHLQENGGTIKIRGRNKDGVWMERVCNRISRTNKEHCESAQLVKE